MAKKHPDQVETFNKALSDGELNTDKLKQLHDRYFPAPAGKAEPPAPAHKPHEQPAARADEKKGLYTQTRTARILHINYDPSKGKPPAKLAKEWARAITKFFQDAGFSLRALSANEPRLRPHHIRPTTSSRLISDIRQNPDDRELAFTMRELVHCTLPHRDPGDVPGWSPAKRQPLSWHPPGLGARPPIKASASPTAASPGCSCSG